MSASKKMITYLIAFAMMASCLTPIDFKAENIGGRIVVSGQISTLNGRSTVQIGETSKDNRLPIPVSGAVVTLIDNLGEAYLFIGDSKNPGRYYLQNGFGEPGKTYHLEILLPDGKFYKSIPEKIPVIHGSLSTEYEVVNERFTDAEGAVVTQPFLKLYANTILPSTNSLTYLRWSVEEAYLLSPTDFPDRFGSVPPSCFIVQNADPQRIVLYKGLEFPTELIQRQLIASRIIDFSFHEKHYFTSYQTSITTESHEYWRKVNILANQVGSIFDAPPAEIQGNIINANNNSEKTVGYFQAVNETYDRVFLLPTFLPFFIGAETCTFDGSYNSNDYLIRCINCLSVRNSSYVRPDWF